MLKRHKDLLRAIVAPMRVTLAGTAQADGTWQRGYLDRELERLGIAPDGTITPIDALPNASPAEQRARYAAEAAITTAIDGAKGAEAERKRIAAREDVVERAAYTWINRLLALRAMEARGLINETLRNNPDYDGVSEALFILRSDAPTRTAGTEGGWWAVIEDACKAQAEALPGLFDVVDPAAALRPSTTALRRCIMLVGSAPSGFTLEEADTAFADPDAIGWAYQFYQEAAKARVYAKLGSGGKAASRAEIAAATQLFTEPYMVQWLLQNSLGRSYHEAYPDSKLPETWAYYIRQRPEGQQPPEHPRPLHALDLIDPCCGSGHFLREAFDMFAAMYREQHPELSAVEIAERILTRHLHGIDLDPRAAQLAALTLYLRAWEFVHEDARKQRRMLSSVTYRPAILNIATTPSGLSEGSLQRHLRRHPEDRVMKPLLEGVFAALEQADILGSLLRPAEHIDAAIKALQQPHTMQMDFDADDAALRRTITALAHSDPAELKRMLIDRVAQSFHAEAGSVDDVAAQLFGREAEGGVRLLQLLDRKYAVVVTNPPYMGSGNMDAPLKRYVEKHYQGGKHDLYAAFILRCIELCRSQDRVAMVTMNKWMFLRSYTQFRIGSNAESGLLNTIRLDAICDLGSRAFSPDNKLHDGVQVVLFIISNMPPIQNHLISAFRLTAPDNPEQKAAMMREMPQEVMSNPRQLSFVELVGGNITYYLKGYLLDLITKGSRLGDLADVRPGPQTSDNARFTRVSAEVPTRTLYQRWYLLSKGGGYRKWFGYKLLSIDWEYDGARIKEYNQRTGDHWSRNVRNVDRVFTHGYTYTAMGRSFAVRLLSDKEVCDTKGPGIYPSECFEFLGLVLNCRITSFFLNAMSSTLDFNPGVVAAIPIPDTVPSWTIPHLSLSNVPKVKNCSSRYYRE